MDMETLMAQAQDLQSKITAAQDSLSQMHVKGIAENGAVVVDMTGKYDLVSVNIQQSSMTLSAEALSKLVFDACTDAKQKADALIDKTMSSITGGLSV